MIYLITALTVLNMATIIVLFWLAARGGRQFARQLSEILDEINQREISDHAVPNFAQAQFLRLPDGSIHDYFPHPRTHAPKVTDEAERKRRDREQRLRVGAAVVDEGDIEGLATQTRYE